MWMRFRWHPLPACPRCGVGGEPFELRRLFRCCCGRPRRGFGRISPDETPNRPVGLFSSTLGATFSLLAVALLVAVTLAFDKSVLIKNVFFFFFFFFLAGSSDDKLSFDSIVLVNTDDDTAVGRGGGEETNLECRPSPAGERDTDSSRAFATE
jgi:hypothetical protein